LAAAGESRVRADSGRFARANIDDRRRRGRRGQRFDEIISPRRFGHMEFDELGLGGLARHVWRGTAAGPHARFFPRGSQLSIAVCRRRLAAWALIEIFVSRYGIGELTCLIPALAALTRPFWAKLRNGSPGSLPRSSRTRRAHATRSANRELVDDPSVDGRQRSTLGHRASRAFRHEQRSTCLACRSGRRRIAAFAAGDRGTRVLDRAVSPAEALKLARRPRSGFAFFNYRRVNYRRGPLRKEPLRKENVRQGNSRQGNSRKRNSRKGFGSRF